VTISFGDLSEWGGFAFNVPRTLNAEPRRMPSLIIDDAQYTGIKIRVVAGKVILRREFPAYYLEFLDDNCKTITFRDCNLNVHMTDPANTTATLPFFPSTLEFDECFSKHALGT
jgi:hypothetical protein